MLIFKDTKKRANQFAPYTAPDGTKYSRVPMELLEEVVEPQPPEDYNEDLYYRSEQDEAPYVVFTRKSDEQIAEQARARAAMEIESLERQHMLPRPVRDSLLALAEKEAAALGYTSEQLRVVNAGYRRVKELDEQINELRMKL